MAMTMGMALLGAGAALVLAAIVVRLQALLLVGVLIYGGATLWVAYVQPPLILPALLGAICLEVFGLRRVLRAEREEEGAEGVVTQRHNSTRIVPSKMRSLAGR